MLPRILLFVVITIFMAETSFALHPLVTEDTGVQGKGKTEIEMGFEHAREAEDGTAQTTSSVTATIAYGLNDKMDLILGIPYQHIRTKTAQTDGSSATAASEDGMADTVVELKWKFYDNKESGLSLALKPSTTLPTGNKRRGLGNGKMTYGMYFVATQEIEPVTLHLNLMYRRNENRKDPKDRVDLWHASLASEIKVVEKLRIVANIGIDKNSSTISNVDPAFVLGGLVYSISEDLDIDIGYKHGLNKPATDYSVLAGITYRF